MRIAQITPGAGAMYCGNCLRDNALVTALRRLGHDAIMLPVYLPPTLDEADQSAQLPMFFGGINVYLDHHWKWFRKAPAWLRKGLSTRTLLGWASGRAARTRPSDVGDLTESMLLGIDGNQARDVQDLANWLADDFKPDVVCLSNSMLIGMARQIKTRAGAVVATMFQGEDAFLDALPAPYSTRCWKILAERAAEADVLMAPSRYYADLMAHRLGLDARRVQVIANGISLEGYQTGRQDTHEDSTPPAVGYLARMCPEKGLDLLVAAWIHLRKKASIPAVRLKIAGSCGPADQVFVDSLRKQIEAAGLSRDVEFYPNLDRTSKVGFLKSLSAFSVPARAGEAFGLYLIEAWAAGTPVVQPDLGAFTELVNTTGGGLLCKPHDPEDLASKLEQLLSDSAKAQNMGEKAREHVTRHHSADAMALRTIEVLAPYEKKKPGQGVAGRRAS